MHFTKTKLTASLALAALLLTVACGGSGSIEDAYLATASDGLRTITFGQSDTFYAIVLVTDAPALTEVTARWVAVEIEGLDGEQQLEESTSRSGQAELVFHLANNNPWPLGRYRVDILLNGDFERSLEFEVE
jgi:ABC-type glycerol-3-phosphate transport system substrate-binding protein